MAPKRKFCDVCASDDLNPNSKKAKIEEYLEHYLSKSYNVQPYLSGIMKNNPDKFKQWLHGQDIDFKEYWIKKLERREEHMLRVGEEVDALYYNGDDGLNKVRLELEIEEPRKEIAELERVATSYEDNSAPKRKAEDEVAYYIPASNKAEHDEVHNEEALHTARDRKLSDTLNPRAPPCGLITPAYTPDSTPPKSPSLSSSDGTPVNLDVSTERPTRESFLKYQQYRIQVNGSTAPNAAPQITESSKIFRLLDLPENVRGRIFKHSLAHDPDEKQAPNTALLRTCKQVHSEAQPIFETNYTVVVFANFVSWEYDSSKVGCTVSVTGGASYQTGPNVLDFNQYEYKPTTYASFDGIWPEKMRRAKRVVLGIHCHDDKRFGTVSEDFHAVTHLLASLNTFLRSGSRLADQELAIHFDWRTRGAGTPKDISTSTIPKEIFPTANILLHPIVTLPVDLKLNLHGLPDNMKRPLLKIRGLEDDRFRAMQHDVIPDWNAIHQKLRDGSLYTTQVKKAANLAVRNHFSIERNHPERRVVQQLKSDLLAEFYAVHKSVGYLSDPKVILLPGQQFKMSRILKAFRRLF